jgi:hypothetical protein
MLEGGNKQAIKAYETAHSDFQPNEAEDWNRREAICSFLIVNVTTHFQPSVKHPMVDKYCYKNKKRFPS